MDMHTNMRADDNMCGRRVVHVNTYVQTDRQIHLLEATRDRQKGRERGQRE
jgi:hypothetical protein